MDGKFIRISLQLYSLVLLVLTLLQAPLASSRPPVIGYSFSHNVTGTVEMNVTNNTEFVIQIIPPGVITFTVNAVNTLGNGKESSVTGELAWMLQVISNHS